MATTTKKAAGKTKKARRQTVSKKSLPEEAESIESLRRELSEALEQQAATSEILRVIARWPTDIQPVLNVVAENAARLCNAIDALIFRVDSETLRRVAHYGDIPLLVTENGAAYADQVSPDGAVHDPERIQYLKDHIRAVGRALEAGVNVQGYYVWTFMDNLEWHQGTSKRFGLVHVDFDTLKRTIKDSGYWFRDFIKSGAVLPE
jgi:hypothetical protein